MFLGAAEYPDDREIEALSSSVRHTCPHCGVEHSALKRKRDGVTLRSGHTTKSKAGCLKVMDAAEAAGVTEDAFNSTTVSPGSGLHGG